MTGLIGSAVFACCARDPICFVDDSGNIIAGQWTDVTPFSGGVAGFRAGGKWGLIDRDGRAILAGTLDDVGILQGGLARARVGEEWGFVNSRGEFVVQPRFEWVSDFASGLAIFARDGRYGYVEPNGRVRISERFEAATPFDGDVAMVRDGSEHYAIGRSGARLSSVSYARADAYSEGLAAVQLLAALWGFVGAHGVEAIPAKFDAVGRFQEGLCPAKMAGRWGFIDTGGEWVFPPRYASVLGFESGFAAVSTDGETWTYLARSSSVSIGRASFVGSAVSGRMAVARVPECRRPDAALALINLDDGSQLRGCFSALRPGGEGRWIATGSECSGRGPASSVERQIRGPG